MNEPLAATLARELSDELTKSLATIQHCMSQLTDDHIWRRPTDAMNSLGNLLLHLTGNLRQYVVAGVGHQPDTRDRPAEFSARGGHSKAELLTKLTTTVDDAKAAMAKQDSDSWQRQRRIQGFDMTGIKAAIQSISHFRGHTQEIIHMTRMLLGDKYKFSWVPKSREQGAVA